MIRVYIFGQIKNQNIKELIQDYKSRIVRQVKNFELIELKDHNPDLKIKEDQISKLKLKGQVILLSEWGVGFNTNEFIKKTNDNFNNSIDQSFIIANANGFDESCSHYPKMSLSVMTFSHELALLLLIEQIYRFSDSRVGGKYLK